MFSILSQYWAGVGISNVFLLEDKDWFILQSILRLLMFWPHKEPVGQGPWHSPNSHGIVQFQQQKDSFIFTGRRVDSFGVPMASWLHCVRWWLDDQHGPSQYLKQSPGKSLIPYFGARSLQDRDCTSFFWAKCWPVFLSTPEFGMVLP